MMSRILAPARTFLVAVLLACLVPPLHAQVSPDPNSCGEATDPDTQTQLEICTSHVGCRFVVGIIKACTKAKTFLNNLRNGVERAGRRFTREEITPHDMFEAQIAPATRSLEAEQKVRPLAEAAVSVSREVGNPAPIELLNSRGTRYLFYGTRTGELPDGPGIKFFENGDAVRGTFRGDLFRGEVAESIQSNGVRRVTEVAPNGMRSGKGGVATPAGTKFVGYLDNADVSVGELTRPDGSKLIGRFHRNASLAMGKMVNAAGIETADGFFDQNGSLVSGKRYDPRTGRLVAEGSFDAGTGALVQGKLFDGATGALLAEGVFDPSGKMLSGTRYDGQVAATAATPGPANLRASTAPPEAASATGSKWSGCTPDAGQVQAAARLLWQFDQRPGGHRTLRSPEEAVKSILGTLDAQDIHTRHADAARLERDRQVFERELQFDWGPDLRDLRHEKARLQLGLQQCIIQAKARASASQAASVPGGSAPVAVTHARAGSTDSGNCKADIARLKAEFEAMNARRPPSQQVLPDLQALLYVTSRYMQLLDRSCRGQPEYGDMAQYRQAYDSAMQTCRGVATSSADCVPRVPW